MLSTAKIVVLALSVMGCAATQIAAGPLGTSFIYQGQLKQDGVPADGTADLRFTLWDSAAGGAAVGAALTKLNHPVQSGLFAAELDFGQVAFDGSARWLRVEVRVPAGAGIYVPLTPRQPVSPTPYARYAATSGDLKLPFSGSATSPSTTLAITNAGTGGAASLNTTDPTNNNPTLYVQQSGTGRCGHFRVTNTESSLEAVASSTTGSGAALSGYTTGSGPAVFGRSDGTGQAGEFLITNGSNDANALEVDTDGTGNAIYCTARTGHAIRAAISGASGEAIYAAVHGDNAHAVAGWATGDNGVALQGGANGTTGRGVYGYSVPTSGENYGVYGETNSPSGVGVYGEAPVQGMKGVATEPSGIGVHGEGPARGVFGETSGSSGSGVYGLGLNIGVQGKATGDTGQARGVIGISASPSGWGIHGEGPNRGVYGKATADSGVTRGVVGDTLSATGRGVQGYASTTEGANVGVWGGSNSSEGAGVHGENLRTAKSGNLGGPDYGVESNGDVVIKGGALRGNIGSDSGTDGAPFPRPAYDSGWVALPAPGGYLTLTHHVGGDPDDYFVDMQSLWTSGITNSQVGGDSIDTNETRGAYYYALNATNVKVARGDEDLSTTTIRIRIWVIR